MTEQKTEKHEFQSEVKELLNILVYSLYKNKEIFLRELISNAVDALNKVQFEILTNKDILDKDEALKIEIYFNKTLGKFIIEDTGIGMTREELIQNIGTIAHSGTVDFIKKLALSKDKDRMDLIGKFGVGFYSSFMVAKEIHIYTRSFHKNSRGYLWKSKGGTAYTIEETLKKRRGTRIELILKKSEKEFLEKYTIKNILSKYSKFVPFPVYVENEKIEIAEAIWTQPKSSLKEKDYFDFFKFIDNSQEEPETYLHISSDAPVQFNSILYIPKTSLELFGLFKTEPGVDLYSNKVLIQKASRDIFPEYLRFVKGIIDSEEIPLNISRETIQNNIKITKIKKYILKKIFDHLKKIKENDIEKYLRIWNNFNRSIKEGASFDFDNQKKISDLLLFHSSKEPKDKYVDLKKYKERMGKDQKEIYYAAGLDIESIEKNPALEAFKKKDIEVLYLDDTLDEFVIEHLKDYADKKFTMAESADIKLDKKKEEEKNKEQIRNIESFIDYLKKLYGEKIADVRVSSRLVKSPCMLVHPLDAPSAQMEKVIKMVNKDYSYSKKVFEINPDNALIKEMVRIHKAKPESTELKSLSLQLLDNILLREGIIDDIDEIVPRIQKIMLHAAKKT